MKYNNKWDKYLTNLENASDDDNVGNDYHTVNIGFITILTCWNVIEYNRFLNDIKENKDSQYIYVVDDDLPCILTYKSNYLYYPVWDCGELYELYKIKMNDEMFNKLEKLSETITEDVNSDLQIDDE